MRPRSSSRETARGRARCGAAKRALEPCSCQSVAVASRAAEATASSAGAQPQTGFTLRGGALERPCSRNPSRRLSSCSSRHATRSVGAIAGLAETCVRCFRVRNPVHTASPTLAPWTPPESQRHSMQQLFDACASDDVAATAAALADGADPTWPDLSNMVRCGPGMAIPLAAPSRWRRPSVSAPRRISSPPSRWT